MKHRTAVLVALAGIVAGAPLIAQAQEGDTRFYVSPMFSYVIKDDHRGVKNGIGGQLAFGKKLTWGLDAELIGYYDRAKGDFFNNSGSANFYGVGAGLNIAPLKDLHWIYAVLSVYRGFSNNNPGVVKSYQSTVFDSGLGLRFPVFPGGTALRIEGRYRYDQHGQLSLGKGGRDSAYDVAINVGLLIPFGSLGGPTVAEPETPAPEVVPPVEAPAPEAPPAPAAPECKTPQPGDMVDMNGCAVGHATILKGVNFKTGKDELTDNAKTILDGVATTLQGSSDKVEIGGHTDNVGKDDANMSLSQRRADAVKAYLVSKGVAEDRLTTKGYGSTAPIESNDNAAGRTANRRVELKAVSGGEAAPAAAPAEAVPAPAPAEAAPAESAPAAPAAETPAAAPAEAAPAAGETPPATPADSSAPPADATPPPAETPAPAETPK